MLRIDPNLHLIGHDIPCFQTTDIQGDYAGFETPVRIFARAGSPGPNYGCPSKPYTDPRGRFSSGVGCFDSNHIRTIRIVAVDMSGEMVEERIIPCDLRYVFPSRPPGDAGVTKARLLVQHLNDTFGTDITPDALDDADNLVAAGMDQLVAAMPTIDRTATRHWWRRSVARLLSDDPDWAAY